MMRSRDAQRLDVLRMEVEHRMARGDRFSDVEDVINESALSADEKSALWLLGWSYVDWRAQRREARAHLAAMAGADRPAAPAARRPASRLRARIAAANPSPLGVLARAPKP